MANKKKVDSTAGSSGDKVEEALKKTPGSRTRKSTADAPEEKTEAVARKAKSTARKVATTVGGRVKEIAEKIGAKSTRTTAKKKEPGATAGKASAAAKADKSTSTGAGRSKSGARRTKVGALAAGVTSDDVQKSIHEMPGSENMPVESDIEDESATDVKEHFFHDQHVHAGPPPPQPPRDVPDEYGDTKLVLLVRDPEWVYAYWEINDETRKQLNMPRNGHSYQKILRLFKITGRQWPDEAAHYFFDVEVTNDSLSWYVHMPEPNESWCAELGILDESDNFVTVCRSNQIITPRNSISDHVDSEWMIVEESFEKITRLSSASLEAQLRGETATASESILRLIQRQLTGVLHGERAAMSSGIFSSESPVGVKEKDFWLQVHTELILYGATEPDAKVTVQGQPVILNSDGTFSMRFALPDGQQVLEVRARNADGDREEAVTPVVERHTR